MVGALERPIAQEESRAARLMRGACKASCKAPPTRTFV
jgi:hypothetical protein